jgi:hypothetical protein
MSRWLRYSDGLDITSSPDEMGLLAEHQGPTGAFNVGMKYVRKKLLGSIYMEKKDNFLVGRFLRLLDARSISEAIIQAHIKELHFNHGYDLYVEDHLLWHNFRPVENFTFDMVKQI